MVTAGMAPRQALAQVEERLAAAAVPTQTLTPGNCSGWQRDGTRTCPTVPSVPMRPAAWNRSPPGGPDGNPAIHLRPVAFSELYVGGGAGGPLSPGRHRGGGRDGHPDVGRGAESKVLDLCAGTGCLGLGVKAFRPDAAVTCLEKSPEALRYLRENARCALAGLPEQTQPAVRVEEGDLFTRWETLPPGGLDLIVSNPPLPPPARWSISSPKPPGSPPWPWLPAGMVWTSTGPLRSITGPRSAPAGPWCWRSAGSSARRSLICWPAAGWTDIGCRQDYAGNDPVCDRPGLRGPSKRFHNLLL